MDVQRELKPTNIHELSTLPGQFTMSKRRFKEEMDRQINR